MSPKIPWRWYIVSLRDFNDLPKPAQRKAFHFCHHLSNYVSGGILANSECAGLQVGMIEIFHQPYNIYLFGSFLSDEFYTFWSSWHGMTQGLNFSYEQFQAINYYYED